MRSKVRLPNLIIPGAAKSGTTSLFFYLKQHPEVFMPRIKEPMYFVAEHIEGINPDNPRKASMERKLAATFDEYCDLFADAGDQKVIGEATVYYLYYWQTAIPRILETLGDVNIILMLRNPVDRAFSSYKNLVRDGHEPNSFEQAMELEQERVDAHWNSLLYFYRSAGFYSEAVQAYKDNFSRVKVVLFDDFKANAEGVARDCFEFLEIDPGFELHAQRRHNSSLVPRNGLMKKALFRPNKLRSALDTVSRPFISEERKAKIILKLKKSASKDIVMQGTTRDALCDYYRHDIEQLQSVIGRDLSHWK